MKPTDHFVKVRRTDMRLILNSEERVAVLDTDGITVSTRHSVERQGLDIAEGLEMLAADEIVGGRLSD